MVSNTIEELKEEYKKKMKILKDKEKEKLQKQKKIFADTMYKQVSKDKDFKVEFISLLEKYKLDTIKVFFDTASNKKPEQKNNENTQTNIGGYENEQ